MQIVSTEVVGPRASVILKRARTLARMTQSDASLRCHIARSVFSDYERGARDPSIQTLRRLLAPLGFDVSTICLVRRVLAADQLQGPLGQVLLAHLDEVVAVLRSHGATRVWAVGPVVEGLENEFDDIRLHADLPAGTPIAAVMGEVSEVFGWAHIPSIHPVPRPGPEEDPNLFAPDPPCVELGTEPA
ncbi:helix-turn-helix domain-containing protein [Ornithinimicrobium avium]|uniref:XRE family transcriptional regulator n=1 Tax=Ornithinimicrobium avium TaxID=2283195 RepID=A0A345NPB9_9MICO|nr:helix-turn-helix transcriptional regulator [Ornithinimicrobium avium]AXH96877.1 XRE family transcriptional regulator [Ornithinimicrobium avium]